MKINYINSNSIKEIIKIELAYWTFTASLFTFLFASPKENTGIENLVNTLPSIEKENRISSENYLVTNDFILNDYTNKSTDRAY